MTSFRMPGSFPECPLPNNTEQDLHKASHLLDSEQEAKFLVREATKSEAKAQIDVIDHLSALVYILICYQLIKYCHLACMVPVMLHMAVQNVVRPNFVKYGLSIIRRMLDDPSTREGMGPHLNRVRLFEIMRSNIVLAIYWKLVVTMVYHVLFVVYWMVPLIQDGHVRELEHGSWWFISFIGEAISLNVDPYGSSWKIALQVGLPYLILTDMLIFMSQLVLYQGLYVQSTFVPNEVRGDIKGPTLVKIDLDHISLSQKDHEVMEDGLPLALKVNVYETFRRENMF